MLFYTSQGFVWRYLRGRSPSTRFDKTACQPRSQGLSAFSSPAKRLWERGWTASLSLNILDTCTSTWDVSGSGASWCLSRQLLTGASVDEYASWPPRDLRFLGNPHSSMRGLRWQDSPSPVGLRFLSDLFFPVFHCLLYRPQHQFTGMANRGKLMATDVTPSLPSSKRTFYQTFIEKCISDAVKIW